MSEPTTTATTVVPDVVKYDPRIESHTDRQHPTCKFCAFLGSCWRHPIRRCQCGKAVRGG